MKTYKQMILEAKHALKDYGQWGVLTDTGKIIPGDEHPTASIHGQLLSKHNLDPESTSDYFHHTEDDELNIRTHSIVGLDAAIKHFNSLPHTKTGKVNHEHFDHSEDSEGELCAYHRGKRGQVLTQMKQFRKELD